MLRQANIRVSQVSVAFPHLEELALPSFSSLHPISFIEGFRMI